MFRQSIYRLTAVAMAAVSLGGLSACVASSSESQARDYQRLVLTNGQIYTVNEKQPWAEAVVVDNDVIVYVGDSAQAKTYLNDSTYHVDLKGKFVMPGIHDTHLHPLEAASDNFTCMLSAEETMNDWLDQIADCAAEMPQDKNEWLLGWGHSLETLALFNDNANELPKYLLDDVVSDRPVAIMEATSHSAWLNSKALQVLGINSSTPHPTGGAILRHANGEANGILLDGAGDLAFHYALAPTETSLETDYQSLLAGLDQVAANGITSIVDARVYWQRGYEKVWQRAAQENTLTARAVLSLWAYPDLDDDQQLKTLASMYQNDESSLLKVNQIKLYSDGITHNTTAAVLSPYLDYFHEVGPKGLNYFSQQRLTEYVQVLGTVGFDMHIHTIGDRGVREALNAIEQGQVTGARHKLTHVEMVNDRDKPRFKSLGVTADFQLAGDFTKPEHHHDMAPLIGERAQKMLPVRDIYDTGANVTLSSDWDVSTLSPFVGMQNTLMRGQQSFPDLDSVIRAYTINGAYVMRQEDQTGSIEVGKKGDFTVVNQNLFKVPVTKINQTKVNMTIVGGDVVYESRTQ